MARRGPVTGLDIGSTKVAAIVGDVDDDGDLHIVGFGTAPSVGMRRGMVVDLEATAAAIEEAVDRAERMAGVNVTSAFVAISGEHIASSDSRGVVAVARGDHEIAESDVARAIDAARMAALPSSDREIIHLLPRDFVVDGQEGVKRPVGMYGTRLEVEVHIVTGTATALANVTKCAQRAGIEVEEMVLAPLASAEAVLTPAERDLGAVVVDVGGGTTSLAVFANGGLCYMAILPVAGAHLTNDIAVGMRTPMAEAEKLKVRWGAATPEAVAEGEMIEVFNVGGKQPRVLPRQELAQYIEPRLDEIFSMVGAQLRRSGYFHRVPAGLVLTGGTALLDGLVEYAGTRLGLPARLGLPDQVTGLVETVRNPSCSTGVGLAMYGARTRGKARMAFRDGGASVWDRARAWVRDLLQGG